MILIKPKCENAGLWYYVPGNGLPDRWIQEVDCQVQADAGLGGSTAGAVINN